MVSCPACDLCSARQCYHRPLDSAYYVKHSRIALRLRGESWEGRGLVVKVLALQAQGPEFYPQHPHKGNSTSLLSQGWGIKAGSPWSAAAGQPLNQ